MPSSPSESLHTLLGERGACPVCDRFDCNHQFYGEDFYRFGDPMAKLRKQQGKTIVCDRRIEENEQVKFVPGDLMTPAEAERYGVTPPRPSAKGRRKGERSRKPDRDASRQPDENRLRPTDGDR